LAVALAVGVADMVVAVWFLALLYDVAKNVSPTLA
jgi:hypothetical protein